LVLTGQLLWFTASEGRWETRGRMKEDLCFHPFLQIFLASNLSLKYNMPKLRNSPRRQWISVVNFFLRDVKRPFRLIDVARTHNCLWYELTNKTRFITNSMKILLPPVRRCGFSSRPDHSSDSML
jgi:hypothetical protein